MSDKNEYTLRTELGPGCVYHECDETAKHLWAGVEYDDGELFKAVYCSDHSQSHAEVEPGMIYIGEVE